jgi:hypothetical protein
MRHTKSHPTSYLSRANTRSAIYSNLFERDHPSSLSCLST